MKKLISLLIAAILLISVCAFAEGKEVVISNLSYSDDEGNALDFSGIELKFAVAQNETQGGLSVAVAANGEEITRAVLSADDAGIYLSADGISDTYSISMELIRSLLSAYIGENSILSNPDQFLQAFESAATEMVTLIPECLSDGGTTVSDGVEYQVLNLDMDVEATKKLYAAMDPIFAYFPFLFEGTGYTSIADALEGENVNLSFQGQILMNDNSTILDLYAMESGEATLNAFMTIESEYYDNVGLQGSNIYLALYDPTFEDVDEGYLGFALLTVYTDPITGAFDMVDLSFGDSDDPAEQIYMALSPANTEDDYSYFTISTMDDSLEYYIIWGEAEEGYTVMIEYSDEDGNELEGVYLMPDDGMGSFYLDASAEGDSGSIYADVTLVDSDDAWLPTIGETVDITTMDDVQGDKLLDEAMTILGELIAGCSATNDDFAAIVSSMM